MRKKFIYLLLGLTLLAFYYSRGQDTIPEDTLVPAFDSLEILYPFLSTEKNGISGAPAHLSAFFGKLERLEKGGDERVVIVHIGDSHIQAGFVTEQLRVPMQAKFGNAGPGVMFPYRLAKSNGPPGYISASGITWTSSRNASPKRILPTGLSGFTLWSSTDSAIFTIAFTKQPGLYGTGATLSLYHAQRDTCFSFRVYNDSTGHEYPITDTSKSFITNFLIDDTPGKIRIMACRKDSSQRSATFYGMNLVNSRPGVIVHTIGVNGAKFSDYLESEFFTGQLAKLNPDLIIFSLGTNEAAATKSFDTTTFRNSIDSLVKKMNLPAEILFTTPPGIYKAYRKKRKTYYKPNPVAGTVSGIIKSYATENGYCSWDWYTVMGGPTAMAKWKGKKMTDRKYIHFTAKGYRIQGMLLQDALLREYERFKIKYNTR